jgi:hypothetical protein
MCTVLLPLGDNPIAVNKYIISYFTKTTLRNLISAKILILPLCKFCWLTDQVFKVYNVPASKERNSLIFRINYSNGSLPPGVSGEEEVTRTGISQCRLGLVHYNGNLLT